jgi:hypothetical protein
MNCYNILENKYSKIYFNLINSRKTLSRSRGDGNYYEQHHIIPKSFGGNNSKQNLILFTAREHFLAHWLLTKCSEGDGYRKMIFAFRMMFIRSEKHIKNGRVYAKTKEIWTKIGHSKEAKKKMKLAKFNISEETKEKMRLAKLGKASEKHPMYGKTHSEETKEKMRLAKLGKNNGENNPMYGKTHSEEVIEKIRQTHFGKKHSEETKEKMRLAKLGKVKSNETKQKMRESKLGKKLSEEHKEKLRQARKNKKGVTT